MNITIKQLKSFEACQDGIKWFKNQKNREAKTILRKLLKEGHFDYARWYVSRLFTHHQAVLFSIFCAERCINLFEKKFPNDSRPRVAIEAAKAWLISPSEKTRNAAYAAYTAAYAADYAATCATDYDAAYAASYAAYTAGHAAYAASYGASCAASYAAYYVTKYSEKEIIIERAIEILGL